MAYYGVDFTVRIEEINLQFKNVIRNKGGQGLRALANIFMRFDKNGNKKLDKQEFEAALASYG
jgi:hypothetical protein